MQLVFSGSDQNHRNERGLAQERIQSWQDRIEARFLCRSLAHYKIKQADRKGRPRRLSIRAGGSACLMQRLVDDPRVQDVAWTHLAVESGVEQPLHYIQRPLQSRLHRTRGFHHKEEM